MIILSAILNSNIQHSTHIGNRNTFVHQCLNLIFDLVRIHQAPFEFQWHFIFYIVHQMIISEINNAQPISNMPYADLIHFRINFTFRHFRNHLPGVRHYLNNHSGFHQFSIFHNTSNKIHVHTHRMSEIKFNLNIIIRPQNTTTKKTKKNKQSLTIGLRLPTFLIRTVHWGQLFTLKFKYKMVEM